MPLIEVYARWRDANDQPQQQFISSVSSPAEGLRGKHIETWLADAIKAADHIEQQNQQTTPEVSPSQGKEQI